MLAVTSSLENGTISSTPTQIDLRFYSLDLVTERQVPESASDKLLNFTENIK